MQSNVSTESIVGVGGRTMFEIDVTVYKWSSHDKTATR